MIQNFQQIPPNTNSKPFIFFSFFFCRIFLFFRIYHNSIFAEFSTKFITEKLPKITINSPKTESSNNLKINHRFLNNIFFISKILDDQPSQKGPRSPFGYTFKRDFNLLLINPYIKILNRNIILKLNFSSGTFTLY